ncbi:Hypothetical Protein FCC1311_043432 [Hondaea fermentalgiana]|uniref:Uncharacterized protein n=1 Tax=Hondaea fermentalgiana TaxID=2315210 RepID=A0A2R5GAU4_9STRA|nr:Hypothetical Protein FCC1311_043432 [Hondaea fermentalgiana]|eukprot:GBG28120.1 Hypothetical Protein FCC1311_043432 [Hondaea fermentalgiana]
MLRRRAGDSDEGDAYSPLDDDGGARPLAGDYEGYSDHHGDNARYGIDEDGSDSSHGTSFYGGAGYYGDQQQQQSATDRAAARAKELSSSFQAGASKFFKSTKDWIREKAENASRAGEEGFNELRAPLGASHQSGSGSHDPRSRRHAGDADDDIGPDPAALLFQESVPFVPGQVVSGSLDPSRPETRALYRSLPVYVPQSVGPGQEFVVALPTGEARLVILPASMQGGERVTIAYKGYIPEGFGIEFVDEEESDASVTDDGESSGGARRGKEALVRRSPDERLVEMYRKHNPQERDALLERSEHGFGIEVYDGEFGAHVHHAVFVGVQTMIAADDLIVSANGEPVVCKADFVQILDAVEVHRCGECDWALCDECFQRTFEAMNSGENANRGEPEWANRYQESYGAKLSFSTFDKGTKLRIYWHTTGEWWLGEVANYQPGRGHEIIYEEGSGPTKQMSKQTIPDISVYTYKVLRPKPDAADDTAVSQDHLGAAESEAAAKNIESFTLNEDERSLLDSIEKDLGTNIEADLSPNFERAYQDASVSESSDAKDGAEPSLL